MRLLFPFIGVRPKQFDFNKETKWSYMGREKFKELLDSLYDEQWRHGTRSAVWLYGTKGYGKSHLLAALAYYLSASKDRIVYIPDCRDLIKDPIPYIQAAMMFAWAEEDDRLREIACLGTLEKINKFIKSCGSSIFIIGQMDALATRDRDNETAKKHADISTWLTKLWMGHKAIISSSANYQGYLERAVEQTTEDTLRVYDGLTPVSLNSNRR